MSVRPHPVVPSDAAASDDGLARLLHLLYAPDPDDVLTDARRLAAVLALGLHDAGHDTPVDAALATLLADLAADLGAPVALLNGVLPDALVVAAAHGLQGWLAEARATPLEWSPCRDVVRHGRARVVPDLAADATTRESPLVAVDGLRAYAGVPLHAFDGSVVGALCVLDSRPRDDFGADQVERLQTAAWAALRLLEQRAAGS